MVNKLKLALYHLVMRMVARFHMLATPTSSDTYVGLQSTLAFLSASAHGTCDTRSEAEKHSLIFLYQSYELTTSSGEKVACKNFVIL